MKVKMDSDGSQDLPMDMVMNKSPHDYRMQKEGSQVLIVG